MNAQWFELYSGGNYLGTIWADRVDTNASGLSTFVLDNKVAAMFHGLHIRPGRVSK